MHKNHGFTLIELSIVIVIIGLIAGGVMIGRDLIRASEIRSAIREMETINTAVNTFRLKFNAMPGDWERATSIFGERGPGINCINDPSSGNLTCNGNGNGIVQAGGTAFEGFVFFHHLELGGYPLLRIDSAFSECGTDGTTCNYPLKLSETFLAVLDHNVYTRIPINGQKYVLGGNVSEDGLPLVDSIRAEDAYSIDIKIDDGMPESGNTQHSIYTTGCGDGAVPPKYAITNSTIKCALLVRAAF